MRSCFLILSFFCVSLFSFSQVTNLSAGSYAESDIRSQLTSCNCNRINVTGVVNLTGDWNLVDLGAILIVIQPGGALRFSGNGNSYDELRLGQGSFIYVIDKSDSGAISHEGGGGHPQIRVGSFTVKGKDFPQLIALGGVSTTGFGAVLPVKLSAFFAVKKDSHVSVKWETTSEKMNAGFEVYRSIDANHWQLLGFVEGNGDSKAHNFYEFKDNDLKNQNVYYRLKQIDFDGSFSFSKIIIVKASKHDSRFVVFPNPAQDVVYLCTQGLEEEVRIELYNSKGELVLKESNPTNGISITELMPGLFYIKVFGINNDFYTEGRFVKK